MEVAQRLRRGVAETGQRLLTQLFGDGVSCRFGSCLQHQRRLGHELGTLRCTLTRRYTPAGLADASPARFVHSLLPIAFGYTVAHYFSLAVFQGQAGYLLATDPLGRGWDLLHTTGRSIDYTLVTPQAIALVQVAAIVGGHMAAVVAAHDRAVATFRRNQRSGQYPLLAVMMTYSMGGVALLVG